MNYKDHISKITYSYPWDRFIGSSLVLIPRNLLVQKIRQYFLTFWICNYFSNILLITTKVINSNSLMARKCKSITFINCRFYRHELFVYYRPICTICSITQIKPFIHRISHDRNDALFPQMYMIYSKHCLLFSLFHHKYMRRQSFTWLYEIFWKFVYKVYERWISTIWPYFCC